MNGRKLNAAPSRLRPEEAREIAEKSGRIYPRLESAKRDAEIPQIFGRNRRFPFRSNSRPGTGRSRERFAGFFVFSLPKNGLFFHPGPEVLLK
nr:hypothetical protein [Bacillaceae bacterium]